MGGLNLQDTALGFLGELVTQVARLGFPGPANHDLHLASQLGETLRGIAMACFEVQYTC